MASGSIIAPEAGREIVRPIQYIARYQGSLR
jgi:hypothetical protein